jgi:hypothetical protein
MKKISKDQRKTITLFLLCLLMMLFMGYIAGYLSNPKASVEGLKACYAAYNDCADKYNALVSKVENVYNPKPMKEINFSINMTRR